jgi:glycosyltransferase involved in cell wall biosynthesis
LWKYGTPYERDRVDTLNREGIETFWVAEWDGARPYLSFIRAWQGVEKRFRGRCVQFIHSHCQFGDILALLVKSSLGATKLFRTVHNEREWTRRPWRRWLLTNLLYPVVFDKEIGVSTNVVQNLDSRLGARFLRKSGLCIYNAIDLNRFDRNRVSDSEVLRKKRLDFGIDPDDIIVLSVGRLEPQKGYTFLLDAARILFERYGHFEKLTFLIVGDGELRNRLQNKIINSQLQQRVKMTGPRDDIPDLLALSDFFVSSSLWEGLPTVILEAMASHVPVIATDVSGTRELIKDGITGYLVPPADSTALVKAICDLLGNPERAQSMAQRGYEHVQIFSIQQVAQQYLELYTSFLA